jgi:hypothetical protein
MGNSCPRCLYNPRLLNKSSKLKMGTTWKFVTITHHTGKENNTKLGLYVKPNSRDMGISRSM